MKRDFRKKTRGPKRFERGAVERSASSRPTNADTRWVGGLEAVERALTNQPEDLREVWIEHEFKHPALGPLIRRLKEGGVVVQFMSRPELDRAVRGGRHGGIAARLAYDVAETFAEWVKGLSPEDKKGAVVIVLDQIQDPHNLGAISRSALQLGAKCIVIPERRSSPVTPAVVQASAGAALKIPIHIVVNLAQTLALCKDNGFWIYGADAAGKDSWTAPIHSPSVLVIGSEGYGMRQLVRASCDELLRVPQAPNGVGSLNAACAATALLYELARRRATESGA